MLKRSPLPKGQHTMAISVTMTLRSRQKNDYAKVRCAKRAFTNTPAVAGDADDMVLHDTAGGQQ
jgi:hypothetical protein